MQFNQTNNNAGDVVNVNLPAGEAKEQPPLTEEAIRAMPAGEGLDALVSERVMGWRKNGEGWRYAYYHDANGMRDERWCDDDDYYRPQSRWTPSEELADAWQVVKNITREDSYFSLTEGWHNGQRFAHANLWFHQGAIIAQADAPSAALAICRCALLTTLKKETPS